MSRLPETKGAWLSFAACAFVSFAFTAEAFAVNPITGEGRFLSDPAGRVGPDGRLWVFGSRDERPDVYCSKWNDALSTGDLLSWAFHPGVFEASRIPGEDTVLYAPDALFANGKWHLFYCTPSRHMEGVATAGSAAGPYGDARPYAFANQIDPSVFRDDDGTVYYTWGQFSCKCAVLKPDLSGVVPGSVRDGVLTEAKHNFHEGSQLFKRNGVYYLAFADIGRSHAPEGDAFTGKPMDWGRRRPTCIGYATAPTPFGPYTYRGVIIDNAGCDPENWNNHGSVVEFKGRWYVLYHRTTNGSRSMRKACIEPIEFDANGLIREAEMTSNGAGAPFDPFARTEARLACGLTGHARIVTLPGGQERIGEIRSGDTATWRYFDFPRAATAIEIEAVSAAGGRVVVSDGRGLNYAEGEIPSGDGVTPRKTTVPISMPLTAGRQAVRIAFFTANGGPFGSLESFIFK